MTTTLVIALVAVLTRVSFVHDPPSPDEGGYLVVAKNWNDAGPFSYGRLFVDRPPVLLLIFRLASLLGGITPLRWIGCAGVAAGVVAAGWAGSCLSGRKGARWAALVTAALMTTPMLGAHEVDGELIAAPLVLLSCACLLQGLRRLEGCHSACWAATAGLTATLALLVKQNFVDGLVFGVVVLGASLISRRGSQRQIAAAVAGYLTGILTPVVAVLAWATTWGPGLGSLLYATYGFRSDATHTLLTYSLAASGERLHGLASAALTSGIVVVAALFLARLVGRSPRAPAALGVAAMFVTSSVGVLLGLSYWLHYLIQLVPALALASAWLSRGQGRTTRVARLAVVYTVVASLVSTGHALVTTPSTTTRADDTMVDRWISSASRPHDTILVTYGHADLIYETGLRPAAPYIWSLPLRTLDPRLLALTREIDGPAAPTWILDWSGFDSWKLDTTRRLNRSVGHHYRRVQTVCAVTVFLHKGLYRALPAPGPCPG